MTETKRTSSKSSGAKHSAKRDAYDEFLERTERSPKKSSAAASPRSNRADTAGKTARKSGKSGEAYQNDMLAVWRELSGEEKPSLAAAAAPRRPSGSSRPRHAAGSPTARPQGRHAAPPAHAKPAKRAPDNAKPRSRRDAYDDFLDAGKPAKRAADNAVLAVSGRDAYDDFLDAGKPAKRPSSKQSGLTAFLLLSIAVVVGLMGWQYARYEKFLTMKSAVERDGFYEGTTVEGVDVSGMSLQDALDRWQNEIEPTYSQRKVTLDNGASFTAAELGYTSDYVSVLTNAWGAGRSGSLEERYEAISTRRERPVSYEVTRMPYSQDAVERCVSAIAEQIDRPAQNAQIESFDNTEYTFRFSDEVVGSVLDREKLRSDMVTALNAGGGNVTLSVRAIQPDVTKEGISAQYGMIASAVTDASSSSKNRLSNIRLSMEIINGTRLKPGETFSFNQVVGERTKEKGFKSAPAFSSGSVVDEVGGGICQVSTTLFNAAVKADLEIAERHNHSLTVSYVDKGKDAAVDWGNKDLKFTNNGSDDVYISCFLDDKKRVRFGIFGKLLPNGETITLEAKTTDRLDYDTEYVPNMSLPSGATQVTKSGKKGYMAEAYKVRRNADGDEISRELLCKSTYRPTKKVVEYGP